MTNRKLFDEITRNAGLTFKQVAKALGISTRTLYSRRHGITEFRAKEILQWMIITGCKNGNPVFFSQDVT